jgi:hypothetical protein
MRSKLDDIYDWFQQNLQGRRASTASHSPQPQPPTEDEEERLLFSVALSAPSGNRHQKLLCPRASFQLDCIDLSQTFEPTKCIFQCHCQRVFGRRHHSEELHVTCKQPLILRTVNPLTSASVLPSSILVRVTQPSGLQWHMYGASKAYPNRSSSIYISGVKSSRMCISMSTPRHVN